MSVSFTLTPTFIVGYLIVGVVLWLPATYVAIRGVRPRRTLWGTMRVWKQRNGWLFVILYVVLGVIAWPAKAFESVS